MLYPYYPAAGAWSSDHLKLYASPSSGIGELVVPLRLEFGRPMVCICEAQLYTLRFYRLCARKVLQIERQP